jgi:hypothetical protein
LKPRLQKRIRRLKPRLQKRSPPPRTEENNVIFTVNSSTLGNAGFVCIDAVSTAESSKIFIARSLGVDIPQVVWNIVTNVFPSLLVSKNLGELPLTVQTPALNRSP